MTMNKLLRLAFWLAFAFAFVMAVLPHPPEVPGHPSDKIQHILAFVTLTALAAFAFPRTGLMAIAVRLSAFGALIEIVQAIPILHRDSDLIDWLADTVAILAMLVVIGLFRRRATA